MCNAALRDVRERFIHYGCSTICENAKTTNKGNAMLYQLRQYGMNDEIGKRIIQEPFTLLDALIVAIERGFDIKHIHGEHYEIRNADYRHIAIPINEQLGEQICQ